jgi:DNA polymerase alpha subunit B
MQTVEDLGFEDVLGFFLQRILTALKGCKTRVLLMPSTDDVIHPVAAFPQPKLIIASDLDDPRFISLPNPATISVGGVVVGVANVDSLFDFQEEGTASFGYEPKENLSRLASHLLFQRSYYPLVPPAPDSSVDISSRPLFKLPPVDILLTPSRLQSFAQECSGVLVVNPGRSSTMRAKMTVARMEIRASEGMVTDDNGVKRGINVAQNRAKVEFYTVG